MLKDNYQPEENDMQEYYEYCKLLELAKQSNIKYENMENSEI